MRMSDGVGPRNGAVDSIDCRIGVAEQPERHDIRAKSATPASWPAARAAHSLVFAARVECFDGPFNHFAGAGEMSMKRRIIACRALR